MERKTGGRGIGQAVRHFRDCTETPRFYQVYLGSGDYEKEGVRVLPLLRFCRELDLPGGGGRELAQ